MKVEIHHNAEPAYLAALDLAANAGHPLKNDSDQQTLMEIARQRQCLVEHIDDLCDCCDS